LQVKVSFHSTNTDFVSYTGSVKDYQTKLKKIPPVYVHVLDRNQSVEQKAKQIYQFSRIPQWKTMVSNFTVNYYAALSQNHRNPYSQYSLSCTSFSVNELNEVQSIKEKRQQDQSMEGQKP
jgi:ribosomal protein L39E